MIGLRSALAPLAFVAFAALAGCASARMSDTETDRLFRSGDYDGAAARLRAGFDEHGQESGRDSLLYLFDLGLSLHMAGKYEESNSVFLKADKLAEIKDYTSLATEAGTLLVSENMKSYKAEDFEYVLVSAYLAMNYAALGQFEDALVEARRVNRKLGLMVSEGKRPYKQNAFARYLSGILYESQRDWDDAWIDYKETLKLAPQLGPTVGPHAIRVARLGGHRDDADRLQAELKLSAADVEDAMKLGPKGGLGEVVVLYQNGISPRKRPSPMLHSVPEFYPRFNPVLGARVSLGDAAVGQTTLFHDIEATAIENLKDKYAGIIAKKVAGIVAKEVVADQVAKQTKNEGLGALASLILHVADQADVRSWNLLPRDLQVLRVPVKPGLHTIKLQPIGADGVTYEKAVQVEAGKKAFVTFRYMP